MANQTYSLILTGNAAGQFVQNILHWRMDDSGFANRLLSAKGLVDGFIAGVNVGAFLNMCPDSYILQSVKARRITNGGGPEYVDVSVQGSTGTAGSGMQASANGPTIIWNTDGGPRRVGKTFIPGISPDNMDGGEITQDFLDDLLTAASQLSGNFTTVGGGGVTCVFCIPRHNDPATRSLVVDFQVSKMIGKQRRRQLPV